MRTIDPDVLAVQPLLLYPSGSVQSAGVVFPPYGGLPYNMLAEYPPEDAAGLAGHRFSALTGAALVLENGRIAWPEGRAGTHAVRLPLKWKRRRIGELVTRQDADQRMAQRLAHPELALARRLSRQVVAPLADAAAHRGE